MKPTTASTATRQQAARDAGVRYNKMTPKWRFTTAVIVAPLSAPLVMFLLIFLSAESLKQFILSGATQYSGYLSSFEIVMFAGAIVAYAFVVIFGIPLYFIFRKLYKIYS